MNSEYDETLKVALENVSVGGFVLMFGTLWVAGALILLDEHVAGQQYPA